MAKNLFVHIKACDHLKAFDQIQAVKEEPEEYNCEHYSIVKSKKKTEE